MGKCFRTVIDDPDPGRAVETIVRGAGTDTPALTCLFVDAQYDLDGLAVELRRQLRGPVLACTTAGHQIPEVGIMEHGMVAAAIVSERLSAVVQPIYEISRFGVAEAQAVAGRLGLDALPAPGGNGASQFGVVLIDGLSRAEERVMALLYAACNGLPLVGGSAGDDKRFERTSVFDGERFVNDAAVIARVDSALPHRTFSYQNFTPRAGRHVVTRAQPGVRQILELDGQSAARVYRDAIGQEELTTQIVSQHPLLLRWDGREYARAIKGWEDGRLDMFCAVEEGMVVRIGQPRDLVGTTEEQLQELCAELGRELLVIVAFTCFQRRLQIERNSDQTRQRRLLEQFPYIEFYTFGEQYNALHMNQMVTGFVLGI